MFVYILTQCFQLKFSLSIPQYNNCEFLALQFVVNIATILALVGSTNVWSPNIIIIIYFNHQKIATGIYFLHKV